MELLQTIAGDASVAVVGMAKNTGKTTCLNYLLRRLHDEGVACAVTSIGVDGEERDVLYRTPKPRITVYDDMLFVTSETDFAARRCPAKPLSVSDRSTPLGRLVTAQAQGEGHVVLSGPSDSQWLRDVIRSLQRRGAAVTLVDGALSRMSLASPAVTDALILCTGAACAATLPELVRQTQFRCAMIDLDPLEEPLAAALRPLGNGVWRCDDQRGEPRKIADSVFAANGRELGTPPPPVLYVGGALTEPFFRPLSARRYAGTTIVVRDFTKLFIEPATCEKFIRRGGRIRVLQKAALRAVCTNPVAPQRQRFDPRQLRDALRDALPWPVYDIMLNENE